MLALLSGLLSVCVTVPATKGEYYSESFFWSKQGAENKMFWAHTYAMSWLCLSSLAREARNKENRFVNLPL